MGLAIGTRLNLQIIHKGFTIPVCYLNGAACVFPVPPCTCCCIPVVLLSEVSMNPAKFSMVVVEGQTAPSPGSP